MMTLIYFIIALGILVFIHEFGHFIVAKKQGIGVEKFSLGFGPKIFGFRKGETEYLISALPFGGYVKLMGEDPEEAEKSGIPREKNFSLRPIRHRVPVVFAGPAMNLILALVLMPIVFMMGRMEPVYLDQKPVVVGIRKDSPAEKIGIKKGDEIVQVGSLKTDNWKEFLDYVLLHGKEKVELVFRRDGEVKTETVTIAESPETHAGTLGIEPMYFIGNEPVIDEVTPGSPAEEAGIRSGDTILEIDQVPITTWTEMTDQVAAGKGQKLAIVVKRGEEIQNVFIVPRYDEGMKKWLLGIKKDTQKADGAFQEKKYSLGQAVVRGFEENVKLSELTFSVLGRLVTFQLSYKTLGGPIRIAQASAVAAKSGLSDFLYFLCFLSLQLGILNLLPLPVLDGGHLLFFSLEAIRRKPVSLRVRMAVEQAGFFLLITLMALVTLNDIQNIWNVGKFFEKVKSIF